MINYMSNGKVTIIDLMARLIKKIYKMSYFPEPDHSKNEIKVN